jgi:hypothetical protein
MVPFEELQRTFAVRYPASDPLDLGEGTVVVLPSLSFPTAELRKIVGIGYYEERLLFLLLLLRRPQVKVVYLTSMPVEEAVVDYYLSFLPDPAGARSRLHMLAAGDPAPPLAHGQAAGPARALDRVRELCEGPGGAFVQPFNVTHSEQELSERLGLPLYGPPAALAGLGSKTGSRRVARLAGVPVLDGAEDLRSVEAVEAEARRLQGRARPAGGGGGHQAQRRLLRPGQRRGRPGRPQRLAAGLAGGVLRRGGVLELVRGQDRRGRGGRRGAPGRPRHGLPERAAAHPARRARRWSCPPTARSSAAPTARSTWAAGSRRTRPTAARSGPRPSGRPGPGRPRGDRLLRDRLLRGPRRRRERVFLSEINLRVGGTTHPFGMASLVTDGRYDAAGGHLVAGGRAKSYLATDNLKSPALVGRQPQDVIDQVDRLGLGYDHRRRTGATLHLLGALREYGKMGVTCIGDTEEEARRHYREVVAALG